PDGGRYDPQISHGMLVWLHPPGKGNEKQIEDIKVFWESSFCDKYNWIFVAPVADDPKSGWVGSDADLIRDAVTTISKEYTVAAPGPGDQVQARKGEVPGHLPRDSRSRAPVPHARARRQDV